LRPADRDVNLQLPYEGRDRADAPYHRFTTRLQTHGVLCSLQTDPVMISVLAAIGFGRPAAWRQVPH